MRKAQQISSGIIVGALIGAFVTVVILALEYFVAELFANNVAFLADIIIVCAIVAVVCIIGLAHSLWNINRCIATARRHGAEARKAGMPCVPGYTNPFLVAAFREGYRND